MRSSAAVTVRAFIMLACAVGIPVIALWGSPWSLMLQRIQDFHWPSILSPATAAAPAAPTTALARADQSAASPPTLAFSEPGTLPSPMSAPAAERPYRGVPERLQNLGATHYRLESWGNDGQEYHFSCKIAVGDSPDYTRYFEATDSDPQAAMSDVLQQVEQWKQGGRPIGDGLESRG